MKVTQDILAILEKGDEDFKVTQIKTKLNLYSERTARVLLHILETDPTKYEQKIYKEINKLEDKLMKAYKKISKKMESYSADISNGINHKTAEIKKELEEMQKLL